jgi:hypothetical protein
VIKIDKVSDGYDIISKIIAFTEGISVKRRKVAKSENAFPSSEDLEVVLIPILSEFDFRHHLKLKHPEAQEGFEYDFFHEGMGIAMEVMGYRADDEVYKDILKFHVHKPTRIGVLWVPRWKWIGSKKGDINYSATLKAVHFVKDHINVDGLVVLPYDWEHKDGDPDDVWRLLHIPTASDQ